MAKIESQHPECSSACPQCNERPQQVVLIRQFGKGFYGKHRSVKCKFCSDYALSKANFINYIEIHNRIRASGLYNF